jgi:hypothetical protein
MKDSNGKPNKEQKAVLEKLKTQEKTLDLRNIQKRKD